MKSVIKENTESISKACFYDELGSKLTALRHCNVHHQVR